jgi:hypothetical protein
MRSSIDHLPGGMEAVEMGVVPPAARGSSQRFALSETRVRFSEAIDKGSAIAAARLRAITASLKSVRFSDVSMPSPRSGSPQTPRGSPRLASPRSVDTAAAQAKARSMKPGLSRLAEHAPAPTLNAQPSNASNSGADPPPILGNRPSRPALSSYLITSDV